jgi:hypothetical protein
MSHGTVTDGAGARPVGPAADRVDDTIARDTPLLAAIVHHRPLFAHLKGVPVISGVAIVTSFPRKLGA